MEAVVADFGASRLLDPDSSKIKLWLQPLTVMLLQVMVISLPHHITTHYHLFIYCCSYILGRNYVVMFYNFLILQSLHTPWLVVKEKGDVCNFRVVALEIMMGSHPGDSLVIHRFRFSQNCML